MKRFFNKLLLFIVPILIVVISLIIKYGTKDFFDLFIINDLKGQYRNLFEWFQNCLLNHNNMFYSFYKGLGGNMISTLAYYLGSPLNLLSVFFKQFPINTFIGIIILIKIGISSLTFNSYLKYNYKKDNNKIMIFIYSLAYSLSGYVACYYSNLMWLDVYYMLPLVILGIDKIFNKEKPYLYINSLFLCFIMNFYMSYNLCIFIIIYCIYKLVLINKSNKNDLMYYFKRILLYSIVSFMMASILLIPTIIDMKNNMFRYQSNVILFDFMGVVDNFRMIFSKLFIGSMNLDTRYCGHQSNIYISLFCLINLVMYFFNKKIPSKERKLSIIVIGIFILSILFEVLNFVWHGFSFPNGYNYRYSYLLIFFSLILSFRNVSLFNYKFKRIHLIIIILIMSCICLLVKDFSYIGISNIIISILFIIFYYIFLIFYKKIPKYIYLSLVIIELAININMSFIIEEKKYYIFDDPNSTIALDTFKGEDEYKNNILKNDFQRNNSQNRFSINENFHFQYYTPTTFLTTNNKRLYNFMHNIGSTVTYSTIIYGQDTGKFIDSYLGVKYLYKYSTTYNDNYKKIDEFNINISTEDSFNRFNIYINDDALNLGFVIEKNKDIKYLLNPFEYQNELFKSSTGLNLELFKPIEYNMYLENDIYKIKFKNNFKQYYLYNDFGIPINYEIFGYYSEEEKNNYNGITSFTQGIINFEKKNDEYYNFNYICENKKDCKFSPYIYYFDDDVYKKGIDILKQNQLDITMLKDNKLQGNIEIDKNSILMLTIPYEKGWNIYVDGKKVKYFSVYDSFIGINLKKGNHTIKMNFIPPGFISGIIMSFIGFLIYIIIILKRKGVGNEKK